MTELYIDNMLADMDAATDLSISVAFPCSLGYDTGAEFTSTITIPYTRHNRDLMGDCSDPHSLQMFNQMEHKARVEVDGCKVFEGRAQLVSSAVGAEGYYRFAIVGEGAVWSKMLSTPIGSMMEDWSEVVSAKEIRNGWTKSGALVRFLPVERGTGLDRDDYRARMLAENYHPFIHLGTLLRTMFAEAGYAIESRFICSELFNSLYMSGRWREGNSDRWQAKMDFKAVRGEDSPTLGAHYFGRIFASPLKYFNSIGNLVDMPDGSVEGAYNEGCFGLDEETGRICFTPTEAVTVAFDYHLRWRTENRIKSRTELKGLGSVRFGLNDTESIPLLHTTYDYRNDSLSSGNTYNLIVFEAVEGETYRLLADEVVAEGDVQTRELLSTTQRYTPFQHNYTNPLTNLRLEMIDAEGLLYSYALDWAIYADGVTECGTSELELSVRSQAVSCSPDEPVYFDDFYLYGGEEGMEVTVLAGCSIQPVFYPHPPLEGTLAWSDVADISFTGLDLLLALQQLFDLRVQTDNTRKVVLIEPRSEFCDGEVVDFTERIDPSVPIIVEELGDDSSRLFRLAYRTDDEAVEEMKGWGEESFGEWSAPIHNLFAREGTKSVENSLFSASLTKQWVIASAPSASFVVARCGDCTKRRCVQSLNFPTKIISFRGLSDLPSGEVCNYPQVGDGKYPLLTFFDDGSIGGSPRSLLFEDRDGVEGLHKWWDGEVDTLNFSRRLRVAAHLRPEEMASLFESNGVGCDFRSLYMLRVEGERVLCRLESVSDYNPSDQSVKMVFVTV